MRQSRYTLNGDAAFDEMLDGYLAAIAEAVKMSGFARSIAAIVLGGGYGRGEGGVLVDVNGEKKLYNDLDFFVITENVSFWERRRIDRFLAAVGKKFSREIGVELDFGRAKTLKQLSRMPLTMMWQELKEGHQVVYGSKDIMRCLPDYELRDLPRTEGLQLLLNRGAGLLLAKEALEKGGDSPDELDFIGRNLYKTVLACGDIFLLVQKQYCLSLPERLALLKAHAGKKADPYDVDLYEKATDFKLSPRICPMPELLELLDAAMNLYEKTCRYFFSICYGLALNNLQELDNAFEEKDPFSKDRRPAAAMKDFAFNFIFMRRFGWRYVFSGQNPRLGLLRVLLGLLFEHCCSGKYNKRVREKQFFICWNRIS
ncbi:MAG: hypothetical protein PHV82_01630 [Victivallaceae bacterium]|nr:hypothetical protein [Victivallaceae bacterium]